MGVQEPAAQKKPAVHVPLHVAPVRTLPARPKDPPWHGAVQEEAVSPVDAPYVPQAHSVQEPLKS